MPRRDWNTPSAHTQKPRHGAMHSAAHGRGHDQKRRADKRNASPGAVLRRIIKEYRRRSREETP